MGWLLLDVRHAIRQFGARPGFTLAALLVLSVGIGVNTASFSLVHGLLLRPLPYPDSEAIVSVGRVPAIRQGGVPPMLSNTELLRLRDEARSFDQLAGYSPFPAVLDGPGGSVNVSAAAVSPAFFPLLRTTPHLGRLFTDTDAVEGADRILLLSHGVWTNRFGADPGVLGASIELNDEPHIVVGVLSAGFAFDGIDLWAPLVVQPDDDPVDGGLLIVGASSGIGRLRPGVTPAQAETEVRTILDRAASARRGPPDLELETRVISLREERGRAFRPALLMVATATGLVLLMACANVAGLLLARGTARRRELAIRGALGAGRGRIVRQLLLESLVLSAAGGTLGVALAAGIARAAPAMVPRNVPGLADVGIDAAVLAFAAGLSVATGLLFGVAPALAWSRVDLARTVNDASASTTSGFGRLRANKGQAVLVAGQVALALLLLTVAGLLLRSFVEFVTFDRGFEPANVVIARAEDPARFSRFGRGGGRFGPDELEAEDARTRQFAATLLLQMDRIANLPGVEAVALASQMPLGGVGTRPLAVDGRPAPSDPRERLMAGMRRVSPGYEDVVGLRVLAGRFFTDRDAAGSARVAVVSESFAREAFGGEPAVGQRLAQPAFPFPRAGRDGDGAQEDTWEVIGVVADVATPLPPSSPIRLFPSAGDVYLSMLQPEMDSMPGFGNSNLVVVRTAGDPLAVVPFLREVLADAYPGALVNSTALETILSAQAAQPRFYAACAGIFAAVALLLAAFGIYSLLSYTVSQRRWEIGVRRAMGAGNRAVILLVFRQGGALVVVGLVLGLLAANVATRVIQSLLFGVTRADPWTLVAVTTVLLAVGTIACWLPARQAARIDPMDVLREA